MLLFRSVLLISIDVVFLILEERCGKSPEMADTLIMGSVGAVVTDGPLSTVPAPGSAEGLG